MTDDQNTPKQNGRGGPDPLTLVAGMVAVGTAGWALFDSGNILAPHWMLAIGSMIIGIVLLILSVRTRRET